MTRWSLWLVTALGAALFAFAWAEAPNAGTASGNGADVQTRTQTQVQTQVQAQVQSQAQNRAHDRDSTPAQTDAGACHPADTVDATALSVDVKHDRIQQRLQDGSCLDEAMLDAPAADLFQDRIRDRLHDGSCLLDGTCLENDYDYSYDHIHDGPPPAGSS